ncbi:MAG TPA: serine/threonine-protein kinase [Gemmatimonadaceae bacterium]|nr:serine/threonine-protein kinase [Gemmatimonadaceae bacterium]
MALTPERRRRIEEIFDAVLDAPAPERDTLLDAACAGDAALRDEVLSLLAAHEVESPALEEIVRRAAADLVDGAALAERIGPYRLERELGRGGMGLVYLAERADGHYRRRVAIKLVRGSIDRPELRRRFEAERRILAALDHPNIAHLLDGGITRDGTPYLVMEYVNGLPVDEYCDRMRLTIGERLRLFATIARAVHHAHRNLVVHRDLKPSNILVAADGTPKLLDFGIAKILDPGLIDSTLPLTGTGMRLMTPEYASPEQVRGEPVTTASDVYSLGVVLYELLTGHRPFRHDGRPGFELERQILEREPTRPSALIARARGEAPEGGWSAGRASQARRASPQRLRRQLAGDLDRMVLMALRKEPERRYASAEQMAEDVERYLAGQPVVAHTDSRWYRARMFVRRHRMETLAVGIITLSLAGGGGAAAWQARLAGRERDRAEAALARTQAALRESQAVSAFIIDLFEASDPSEARGDTVTARDLLARGERRIAELSAEPAAQARMLDAVGLVYENLGMYERAQAHMERALALRRRAHGEMHLDVAASLNHLAVVVRRRGAFERADTLLRQALAIQRRMLGERHPQIAETIANLAYVTSTRGDGAAAESLYRASLEMRRLTLGPDHPLVATSLRYLGAARERRGDYDGAERDFREALALRQRVLGASHPAVASTMLDLADLLAAHRHAFSEAERLYLEALAIQRRTLGDVHAEVGGSLGRYAWMLGLRGDHAAAVARFREALAVKRRVFGTEHPLVAEAMDHLAGELLRAGRTEEAEALWLRSLAMERRLYGERHPVVAGTLTGVASLHLARGEHARADSLMREALAMRRAAFGERHPLIAITLRLHGDVLTARKQYAAAESLYLRALDIIHEQYGDRQRDVRDIHGSLAALYDAWGRPADARRHRDIAERG